MKIISKIENKESTVCGIKYCCTYMKDATEEKVLFMQRASIGIKSSSGTYRLEFCPWCGEKIEVRRT